jgi:hypothetical protein
MKKAKRKKKFGIQVFKPNYKILAANYDKTADITRLPHLIDSAIETQKSGTLSIISERLI